MAKINIHRTPELSICNTENQNAITDIWHDVKVDCLNEKISNFTQIYDKSSRWTWIKWRAIIIWRIVVKCEASKFYE